MKVSVRFDTMPKGADVMVHGLGILQNGREYDFDQPEVEFWKVMNNIDKAPAHLVLSDEKTSDLVHEKAQGPDNEHTPATDSEPARAPGESHPVEAEDKAPVAESKDASGGKE